MATVDELVKQYETDPELKKEVAKITEDNKITLQEFFGFVKKYDLKLSVKQLPMIIKKAKEMGFIKTKNN